VLFIGFLLNVARRGWDDFVPYYNDLLWLFWTLCIPVSVLLALQIARITKTPSYVYWNIVLLVPIGYFTSIAFDYFFGDFDSWLIVTGIIVGAFSLLILWVKRDWLNNIRNHKNGRERFWLIMSLIVLNMCLIALGLFSLNDKLTFQEADFIRTILGISFVYITSTSLFRLYPHALTLTKDPKKKIDTLSNSEIEYALKIEDLLNLEKVYQEPSYGRSDMARELEITESSLSKVVNVHFNKSVPQLLNEYRVEEAKVLLKQTEADATTISSEAGFNSMATFNRVFKDMTGVTPSEYRSSRK
jgi:AraC-like DNA-binding protein